MKRRIAAASAVLLFSGGLILPLLAWNCHLMLSGRGQEISWHPVAGWDGILHDGTAMRLYLLLFAGVGCFVVWAVVSSSYVKYRSGMFVVQPGDVDSRIEIPMPAGQGQFGTAWFTPIKRMGRRYDSAVVKPHTDLALHRLLEAGDADYKEVEDAAVTIE